MTVKTKAWHSRSKHMNSVARFGERHAHEGTVRWTDGVVHTMWGTVEVTHYPPETEPPHGYIQLAMVSKGYYYRADFPDDCGASN